LIARYASIATLLPASVAGGFAIGYGLDRLFSTSYLKVVFLVLGVVAGIIQLVRDLSRAE